MLGDVLSAVLASVGVTEERVTRWLGRPCGCRERRDKLNAIHLWARRLFTRKQEEAASQLTKLLSEED